MAAQYDPTLSTPKDRVRSLINDRRAPFRFFDEEIVAKIVEGGEAGEIRAAIELLESEQEGGLISSTAKQGSWSRTKTVTSPNSDRIANLRRRLAELGAIASGVSGSPIAAAEADFPQPGCTPLYDPWGCYRDGLR